MHYRGGPPEARRNAAGRLADNWSRGGVASVAADALYLGVVAGCAVNAARFLLADSPWGCFWFVAVAFVVFTARFGWVR